MNLKNRLKLALVVIALWLVSTSFQQVFATLTETNSNFSENGIEELYEYNSIANGLNR